METITITKKEYEALAFAPGRTRKKNLGKKTFEHVGFGIFRKIPAKMSSIVYVNKLRKSWR